MLKIKKNKSLYKKWVILKDSMEELAIVVKNDNEVTYEYMNDWLKKWLKLKSTMIKTYEKTLKYIENS